MTISPEQIAEWQKLVDAATKGPWNIGMFEGDIIALGDAARTAIPALIADLLSTREELERVREVLKPFAEACTQYQRSPETAWAASSPQIRVSHLRSARAALEPKP